MRRVRTAQALQILPANEQSGAYAYLSREEDAGASRPASEVAPEPVFLLLPQMHVVLYGLDAIDLLGQYHGTLCLVLRFHESTQLNYAVVCGHADL